MFEIYKMHVLSFDPGIKNLGWSITNNDNDIINVEKFGLIDLTTKEKCFECGNKATYYDFENLELVFCCKKHSQELVKVKKIKYKKISEICKILISKLNEIFSNLLTNINTVIIENQPCLMNQTSKNIQIMLLAYFIGSGKNVIFQNPSKKMFGIKFNSNNNKYQKTKKLGIELSKKLLNKKIYDKIFDYEKQDDIFDSILSSISYILDNTNDNELKITRNIIKKFVSENSCEEKK